MRRGVGVGALHQKQLRQSQFQSEGTKMEESQIQNLKEQIDFFKEKLAEFAQNHKKSINKNPELRYRFREMCKEIGVDPLASSKGFWASRLGLGDFYYELAVQVAEICYKSRAENGGLMLVSLVYEKIKQRRQRYSGNESFSISDIHLAIQKLRTLGKGFSIQEIGNETYVLSVPYELNEDHTKLLSLVQNTNVEHGYTISELEDLIKKSQDLSFSDQSTWSRARINKVLEYLMLQGFVWIDQPDSTARYYFVSLQGDLFSIH